MNRLWQALIVAVLAVALFQLLGLQESSLLGTAQPHRFTTRVMGTNATLVIVPDAGLRVPVEEAAQQAFGAMERVERLMSPYNPESDISRLNASQAEEWVSVAPETWAVLMESLRMHRLSGGAFDITVGPVFALYDYEAGTMPALPPDDALRQALGRVGSEKILYERNGMRVSFATEGMEVGLGAIAKGTAVDAAMHALQEAGVKNGLVEAGGEIRFIGSVPLPPEEPNVRQEVGSGTRGGSKQSHKPTRPWRMAIQHPRAPLDYLRELELTDCAVATSGDYEKFVLIDGVHYSHIIDPRTGRPLVSGVVSATVIHPDSCQMADALATTFSVLGVAGTAAFLEQHAETLRLGGLRVYLYAIDDEKTLRPYEFHVGKDAQSVTQTGTPTP